MAVDPCCTGCAGLAALRLIWDERELEDFRIDWAKIGISVGRLFFTGCELAKVGTDNCVSVSCRSDIV